MSRQVTRPAFTDDQKRIAQQLLAARVAHMMGRKFEEGDWADVYCRAKSLPKQGWNNLRLDVVHAGFGIEHKMLCRRSHGDLTDACGSRLMHPSATRSFRMPPVGTPPDEAMRSVLEQYRGVILERQQAVAATAPKGVTVDLRTGWLLWQESLRQFLYFEEELVPPNPDDFFAEWQQRNSAGSRKASTNLWIYEKATNAKRYSVTNEAGAKIQPYFDIPPLSDPNLYVFTVIGEAIQDGYIRVWVTDSTARELRRLLGSLDETKVSATVLSVCDEITDSGGRAAVDLEPAEPIVLAEMAYTALTRALPGVSDEHCFRQLIAFLNERNAT